MSKLAMGRGEAPRQSILQGRGKEFRTKGKSGTVEGRGRKREKEGEVKVQKTEGGP